MSSEATSALYKVEEKPFSGKKLSREELEKELKLPAFPDMVQFIWEQTQTARSSGKGAFSPDAFIQVALQHACSYSRPARGCTISLKPVSYYHILFQIVRYLRLCLARSAGVIIPTNETLTHPSDFTPEIGRYLKQVVESSPETVDHYLEIVHKLLSAAAGKILLDIILVKNMKP